MDVLDLSNLLCETATHGDDDRDNEASSPSYVTPASFGPSKEITREVTNTLSKSATIHSNKETREDKDDIWKTNEIPSSDDSLINEQNNNDPTDTRPSPKYDIRFHQQIGTQDVFLNSSSVTSNTSDCTHLIVCVHFPQCMKSAELFLDVSKKTPNRFLVESKDRRLCMYLPQPVDSENGNAQWDGQTRILTVTLPLEKIEW
mmetsp:Transcript_10154/g.15101  ORF Transcript_10154/g.15101 Transcript_10154/m.15101 type:complete len:202 (+) Transcript_10154:253-858(+)